MSPRPVELPESEFEGALRRARQGKPNEALQEIEQWLSRCKDREPWAAQAATALAEVSRLAEVTPDLATAERALDVAIGLRPHYADLHFQLACVLLARQRRTEARRALDAALRLNPRFMAARVERALLDAREGLIGEALDALRSLAQEIPMEDPRAFDQGLKSLERADWDEADSLLKRGLKLSDPELQLHLERFHKSLADGEPARAVQWLREILPRYESYADLHYWLGLAELKLTHLDDALASFARSLELNPDFHVARLQLARVLEGLGQTAQASEQLTLVLQNDPGNPAARDLERQWSGRRPRRRASRATGTEVPRHG